MLLFSSNILAISISTVVPSCCLWDTQTGGGQDLTIRFRVSPKPRFSFSTTWGKKNWSSAAQGITQMYYFKLHETTLFTRVQRVSELPCNHLQWPFQGSLWPFQILVDVCGCYLVVDLDLCECVVVSQRINQSLHSCPGDEVGFQVQTPQSLVLPQHVAERLGGGTRGET